MNKLPNISPGEILKEEFLIPMGLTNEQLSEKLNISSIYIEDVITNNKKITTEFALKLSKFFGNSTNFWLGLQNDYDIENESFKIKDELNKISKFEFEAI